MTNARATVSQISKPEPVAPCATAARVIPIVFVSRQAVEDLVARLNSNMAGAK